MYYFIIFFVYYSSKFNPVYLRSYHLTIKDKKSKEYMLYIFAAFLCALIGAGVTIAIKLFTLHMSAVAYAFIRYSLVTLALIPFIISRKEYRHLKIRDIPGILMLGLFLVLIYSSFLFSALSYTSATSVALISATSPLWILALAALLRQILLTRLQLTAILLCFIGTLLVVSQGNILLYHNGTHKGELFAVGAVLCQALYSHALRKISMHYSTVFVAFSTAFSGILFVAPFIAHHEFVDLVRHLTLMQWELVVFMSLVGSIASIFLYASALKHEGIARVSLITFSSLPLFTAVLAQHLLGEVITLWHVSGGMLIACSLVIACNTKDGLFFDVNS
jgi:drug/metabolite transporter (DMT)-like permease